MTGSANVSGDIDCSDLAAKLNLLFETFHPKGTPPPSNQAVAAGIEQKYNLTITGQYLGQIRAGKKTNVKLVTLRAIAGYFGVKEGYLTEPGRDENVEEQLELLRVFRDEDIINIATRTSGLSAQSRRAIFSLVDQLRAIEQLPPIDPSTPGR